MPSHRDMKALRYRHIIFVLIINASSGLAAFAQTERTIYVTIESSRRGFIKGLAAENFSVSENGKGLAVSAVTSAAEPVSVGFLFDVSGSVLGAGAKDVNDAATGIYNSAKLHNGNAEFFLLGFNRDSRLLTDWTTDAEKIASGLRQLPTLQSRSKNNVTSLHVACLEALAKIQKGKFSKKALIVFSDGLDTSEDSKLKEVLSAVQASDTLVYFINVIEPTPVIYTLSTKTGDEFIDSLTAQSGGRLFSVPSTLPENRAKVFVRNADSRLNDAFENVFRDLEAQYALRFTPSGDAAADTVRNVNVKVSIPPEIKKGAGTITVRYRKKYRIQK